MLNLYRCRFKFDKEMAVAVGSTVNAEGIPMISSLNANGEEVIKPSAGAGGEKFVGFSYGEKFTALTMPFVSNYTIPAAVSFTVSVKKTNLVPNNIMVYDVTAAAALTEGNPANAGEYSCVDATGLLTFNAAQAGHKIKVTFRYYPTAQELIDTDQFFYKPAGSDFLSQIGCILSGEVFTDQYDASKNWSAATAVKLGAGVLTDQTGAGETVNCVIISVPTVDNPFLGVRYEIQ